MRSKTNKLETKEEWGFAGGVQPVPYTFIITVLQIHLGFACVSALRDPACS